MKWCGLYPEATLARIASSSANVRSLSLGESLHLGAAGFFLVSLAGFAPWLFAGRWLSHQLGEIGLYAVCAAVFISLAGMVLHQLIIGPGAMRRFYIVFAVAFLCYALCWCVCWFLLGGKAGEWFGSLVGSFAMASVFTKAFNSPKTLPQVHAALFTAHSTGYFLGDFLYDFNKTSNAVSLFGGLLQEHGRLAVGGFLWATAYGFGFGAGLGFALYFCQDEIRARLQAQQKAAPKIEADAGNSTR